MPSRVRLGCSAAAILHDERKEVRRRAGFGVVVASLAAFGFLNGVPADVAALGLVLVLAVAHCLAT